MERGEYLVMWQVCKKIPISGMLNRLLGRYRKVVVPMFKRYDSEEIANYGYRIIKSNTGAKPMLLKVVKE